MRPVFIRHNCSSTPKILRQLWEERLIALHYDDSESTKPEDYYPAGKNALSRLWQYCDTGALVGADYRRFTGDAMLIGRISEGSKVTAREFSDPDAEKSFIYKVVKLQDAVEARYGDYPLLVGVQPRQATITGWPAAGRVLEAAISRKSLLREPNSLHPSQLEVLCYEWLRSARLIERLLLPIGRGLVDIDILGINGRGKRIIGQVTHSANTAELEEKERRLLQHARPQDEVYFFFPKHASLKPNPRVKQVFFRQVLETLENSTDSATKVMLDEMFCRRQLATNV